MDELQYLCQDMQDNAANSSSNPPQPSYETAQCFNCRRPTTQPLYRLRCTHFNCRACLTEHHLITQNISASITCALCNEAAGFEPDEKAGAFTVDTLFRSSQYLLEIKARGILDPSSPHYAPQAPFLLDRNEARAILVACYHLALSQLCIPNSSKNIVVRGVPSNTILVVLDKLLQDGTPIRLCTPELLNTEFKIVAEDVVYDHMVRMPGAPHHMLAKYFDTEDEEADFRRLCQVVQGIGRMYPDMGRLMEVWSSVMEWVVGVLAVRWWGRF
jgi:hypothetical protein